MKKNDENEPAVVNMCKRESYPFEEQFRAMSIEGKLMYLFERCHFLARELNVASHRADMMLEHRHGADGQVLVSVHRAYVP
jgi:hypothetical protein